MQKALAANEDPSPRRIDRMASAAGLELSGSTVAGWFETCSVVPAWDKFEVLVKALAAEHDEDWRSLHGAALTADRKRKREQRRRNESGRVTTPVPFEVTIYTSSDEGEPLRDAVVEILTVCGFEVVAQAAAERGSWFQRLKARQRDARAMEKLGELAGKVERAAELKYISAPRSESDEREANAIARLAEAMSTMEEAVVRTSSVLFIKTRGRVLAWILTEDEIRLLNDNPQLMRAPAELMDALDRRAQADRDFQATAVAATDRDRDADGTTTSAADVLRRSGDGDPAAWGEIVRRHSRVEDMSFIPGSVCWIDVSSTDPANSQDFYAGLFGWTYQIDPDSHREYITALFEGQPVAGLAGLPVQAEQPATWTLYLTSPNITDTAQVLTQCGGRVLYGPADAPVQGAVLIGADPTGAVIGFWQPTRPRMFHTTDPGSLYWAELNTWDGPRADEFFANLCGYHQQQIGNTIDVDYTTWSRGGQMMLGRLQMDVDWAVPDMAAHWMLHFAVNDTDAAVNRVLTLGGRVDIDPYDTELGRIARVADPSGATFALIDPTKRVQPATDPRAGRPSPDPRRT